jgi:hypothetical protein
MNEFKAADGSVPATGFVRKMEQESFCFGAGVGMVYSGVCVDAGPALRLSPIQCQQAPHWFCPAGSSGLPIAKVQVGGIIRLIGGTCYETFRPPCSFALGIGFDLRG